MPPIEEADFDSVCLVWERLGFDAHNELILAAPVELDCRWVDDNRMTTDENGTPIEMTASVAIPQKVPTRSLFWHGRKDDWVDDGKQDIHQAISWEGATSIDGKNSRNEYELARFRRKLPANTPEPYA